jgi:hypothetical protein
MMAMEDFETFKKLMVKRNMELQLETIRAYSAVKATPKSGKGPKKSKHDDDEDEDGELEAALEASLRLNMSPLPVPDELKAMLEADGGRIGGVVDDVELQEILRRSLLEMEVMHRQEELEQADLEAAVAMSLALEEDRMHLLKEQHMLQQREEKMVNKTPDHKAERKESKHDDSPLSSSTPRDPAFDAVKGEERHIRSPAVCRDLRDWNDENDAPAKGVSQPTVYEPEVEMEVQSKDDDKDAGGFVDDDTSVRRGKAVLKQVGNKLSVDAFAAPKPLQGRSLGGLSALPSIGAINDKRKQAEGEMRKAQEQLASGRVQEDTLRRQVAALDKDPVDAERRAGHMAEQRDRLIAMKKLEREKRVQAEAERQAKLSADGDEVPEALLRAKAAAQAKARESKNGDEGDEDQTNDDKRRAAMRLALARRMKLDLIESEGSKLIQMAEDQFADLDRKLQQVEQLRRDNKEREMHMADQMRRQQATIARNMQLSAEELRRDNQN